MRTTDNLDKALKVIQPLAKTDVELWSIISKAMIELAGSEWKRGFDTAKDICLNSEIINAKQKFVDTGGFQNLI